MFNWSIIAICALIANVFIGTVKGMSPVSSSSSPASSAFEHRIDIPEEKAIFMEKIEPNFRAKLLMIPKENAIAFLQMFSEITLKLNEDTFKNESINGQLVEMMRNIKSSIQKNQRIIGQNLLAIICNFSTNCQQIGGFIGEAKNNVRFEQDVVYKLEHMAASVLCFIGMFTATAEFINKEMLKIIDKNQLPFGLTSAIARLIGDDGPNKINFDVQEYTAAVEQMHNFWRICKDMMTADSEDANLRYGNFVIYRRIQTEQVKQHLLDLTRYNMCDFVSQKIQIVIPTE